MEYAFKNIESLIGRAISSAQKSKKPLHEQFARVRKAVADEKAKAEITFAMQAVAFDKGEQVTRYVHYHQNRLINFIDELFAGATISTKRNSALVSEILLFVDQLRGLLEFVERDFEPFFNRDAKFPDPHRTAKLKALTNQHKRVQDRLSNLEVSENLKAIISNLINETMIGRDTTYRRMFLTEQLMSDVLDFDDNISSKDAEVAVLFIVITLNVNSPSFINFYTNTVKSECSSLDSDTDKAEKLGLHLKKINQCYLRPRCAYDVGSASTKEQLSNWLWEELQFLTVKEQPSIQHQVKDNLPTDFKLEFDMSVSQFAFFTKAFVESGVIQNKNISELIRFFSRFVKTKRSGSISQESLRIKYYDVESSTKEAVKNTLHTAIGYINSH